MTPWPGAWVEERAGIGYTAAKPDDVRRLAGLALRRNRKRLLLVVSTVLGKHIPAPPAAVSDSAHRLGRIVLGLGLPEPVLVIGFAETATGLGYGVAEVLGDAHYVHSTRSPARAPLVSFAEEHSHATAHHLAPLDVELVKAARSIVLVDDEISTGRTSMNIISALAGVVQCRTFVIASLLDSRPAADRAAMGAFAQESGIEVTTVALGEVSITIPDDAAERVRDWLDARPEERTAAPGVVRVLPAAWPADLVLDGQDGFSRLDRDRAAVASRGIARGILGALDGASTVLVVGVEEFMAVPNAVARMLVDAGLEVRCCSTTRSPVAPIDEDGYAIRAAIEFDGGPDQAEYARFLYNVRPGEQDLVIVVAPESGAYAASDSLLGALAEGNDVLSVRIARPAPLVGPAFSTYSARDVRWLLTDISTAEIESTGLERERTIQTTGHYSESLPVEYEPGVEYLALFDDVLVRRARAVALAAARLAEQVLAARGDGLVLVSLARAGTPAGVLVRRWLEIAHGLDVPHYTMSIILDRGLDPVALDYLRAHHGPESAVFVDGWTGKGSISAELRRTLAALGPAAAGFSAELGVLADPAATAAWAGTAEDLLIPSACLNSTVSGLVSRTAYSPTLIPDGRFHGAKFYSEMRAGDRSLDFIDAVTGWFGDLSPSELLVGERPPGSRDRVLAEIARLRTAHSIGSDSLIKPGVCEATRVLLRRVPELLLVRELGLPDARHLELLAASRGTRVVVDPASLFSAVGIIRSMAGS